MKMICNKFALYFVTFSMGANLDKAKIQKIEYDFYKSQGYTNEEAIEKVYHESEFDKTLEMWGFIFTILLSISIVIYSSYIFINSNLC